MWDPCYSEMHVSMQKWAKTCSCEKAVLAGIASSSDYNTHQRVAASGVAVSQEGGSKSGNQEVRGAWLGIKALAGILVGREGEHNRVNRLVSMVSPQPR